MHIMLTTLLLRAWATENWVWSLIIGKEGSPEPSLFYKKGEISFELLSTSEALINIGSPSIYIIIWYVLFHTHKGFHLHMLQWKSRHHLAPRQYYYSDCSKQADYSIRWHPYPSTLIAVSASTELKFVKAQNVFHLILRTVFDRLEDSISSNVSWNNFSKL